MKVLFIILFVAAIVALVFFLRARRAGKKLDSRPTTQAYVDSSNSSTQAAIRRQVDYDRYRSQSVAKPAPSKTYEMKSKKNRYDDGDEGSVNQGYVYTDSGFNDPVTDVTYTDNTPSPFPVYESEPSRTYEAPAPSYEAPSTPSYDPPSSSSGGGYDSGSSSSSSDSGSSGGSSSSSD